MRNSLLVEEINTYQERSQRDKGNDLSHCKQRDLFVEIRYNLIAVHQVGGRKSIGSRTAVYSTAIAQRFYQTENF